MFKDGTRASPIMQRSRAGSAADEIRRAGRSLFEETAPLEPGRKPPPERVLARRAPRQAGATRGAVLSAATGRR